MYDILQCFYNFVKMIKHKYTESSILITLTHRLVNNTERTLAVVFSRFRGFSFTITLGQSPKELRAACSPCLVIQRGKRETLFGPALGLL